MEDCVAMNGGDGPNSYTRNSKFQKGAWDMIKDLLSKGIQEALDMQNDEGVFRIADLGCSVGPNTFTCVETMIQAVQVKFKTHDPESKIPEFQVFFSDSAGNDFNTLFKALPLERNYMAAGVPGSFYGRLFPEASMNLMNASYAINWLSKVPEEVTNEELPAWNKGRITFALSSNEVVKAFTAQFTGDMEAFFNARSRELGRGGLIAILVPCRPDGALPTESVSVHVFDRIGNAIADMVREGLISEALLDSFNLPVYFPSASEVKNVASANELLRIERIEEINFGHMTRLSTPEDAHIASIHLRAVTEGFIFNHFGSEHIDEIYRRYSEKLEEFSRTPLYSRLHEFKLLFALIKRI